MSSAMTLWGKREKEVLRMLTSEVASSPSSVSGKCPHHTHSQLPLSKKLKLDHLGESPEQCLLILSSLFFWETCFRVYINSLFLKFSLILIFASQSGFTLLIFFF